MNIVRIPRLLKHSTLLLAALGSSLLLCACGGDSNKSTSSSSSSSNSVSSHTFSSTPVTPPLDGIWPNVKVSTNGNKSLKFDWTAAPNATYYKLFKKADATSTYEQIGADFTANTISDAVSVHLTDWVNRRYKVQACTAANVCSDSKEVIIDSAMIKAITYIKASNTETGDWFGWSVAISGDGKTMAVGAPAESSKEKGVALGTAGGANNDSPTSGAVYVFIKVNGNWIQEAYLKASNTEQPGDGVTNRIPNPNARFGYKVALSSDGNALAVSAINEDSVSIGVNCDPHYVTSSASASNSQGYVTQTRNYDIGVVYVFKRVNAQWSQEAYIKPLNLFGDIELEYGYSLAISGDGKTLAVGTTVDSTPFAGVVNAGTNSSNSSSTSFTCINFSSSSSSSNSSSSSSSKSSVTSSGSSSSSSTPGGLSSGAVYIYKLKENGWIEDAYVKASDASPGDSFGISLGLSHNGDTLVVGAIGAEEMVTNSSSSSVKATVTINVSGTDFTDYRNSGAVYVYKRLTDGWQQNSKIFSANQGWQQLFGYSLALSDDGKTLAVGTPGDWSLAVGTTGSPTNFTYEATFMTTPPYITPTFSTTREKSSYGSGAAYVYKYSNDTNTWIQEGYLKASNPQTGEQFGYNLALSGNGNVLAVGSWLEASQATGINGDQLDNSSSDSGAAYLFTRTGTTWSQKSYIKAPNTHEHDRFARALGLDELGENLVIGAYRESSKATGVNGDQTNSYIKPSDAPAAASGAVYIY